MSGYNHDLHQYAQKRGWSVQKTNGNHLKLTHPSVPSPVFASSTPSDHRSLNNVMGQMRRAERAAGVTIEMRNKRRTEPFVSEIAEGWITHTAMCSSCGALDHVKQANAPSTVTDAHIANRFRIKGWRMKAKRTDDLCPACAHKDISAEAVTIVPPEAPVEVPAEVSIPQPIPERAAIREVAPPAPEKPSIERVIMESLHSKQLAIKRRIAATLSKVYIADAGYLPGESDATVARKVGTDKELVEIVRRDFYGTQKQAAPLAMLKRAVHGYRRDLKEFEQSVIDRIAKLESDAAGILKWLDQIEENAVPPCTPSEPELPLEDSEAA